MVKIRTIKSYVSELKKIDANSAISEHFVIKLVLTQKIPSIRSGAKYLLDANAADAFLASNPTLNTDITRSVIRSVKN